MHASHSSNPTCFLLTQLSIINHAKIQLFLSPPYLQYHLYSILANPDSGCSDPCYHNHECYDNIICINQKCFNDPKLGTHVCDEFTYPYEHCDAPTYKRSPPIKPYSLTQFTFINFGLCRPNNGTCNLN